MLFTISDNYGSVPESLKEKLAEFKFNYVDYKNATIELSSLEELIKLIKTLGEDEFEQKVLVREGHITYWFD